MDGYTPPKILTVKELAAYLRVHPSTIYKLMKKGLLPGFRIGTDWRFNLEAIDRWCMEHNLAELAKASAGRKFAGGG